MQYSYHYLLMCNHLFLQKLLFSQVKSTGLTLGQPKVLDYLKDHNGATQKEIAHGCHIEPASLTSILGGMEKKDLITRTMQNGNRRNLHVFLTKKGQNLQQQVDVIFSKLEEIAFQGFSEEEQVQTIQILSKIYKNLINYQEERKHEEEKLS